MNLKNIFLGLLGISLVITVHELGHWSMCQFFNVGTPRFSIGFGPVLAEKQLGQTLFTISALPIGGYVEITGMRAPETGQEARSFINKPFYQKTLIMLGGIIFNALFALLTFFVVGFRPPARRKPESEPEPETTLTDQADQPDQSKQPEKSVESGIIGPLGIIGLASKSASYGISFYFFFLAILSANLAIFNLFPLPILDGGQLLIIAVETAQGHQIKSESYELIMSLTTFFIFALLVYATTRDLQRAA